MHIPRMLLVYAATMLGFIALRPAHANGYSAILDGKKDCKMTVAVVPQTRLEVLFDTGRADLLIPASKTPKRDVCGFDCGPTYQELVTSPTQQGRFLLEVDALSITRLLRSGVVWKGFQQYYAPAVLNGSIAPL